MYKRQHLHVFPYSDRPGTAASGMRDKVDGDSIRRRGAALREVGARLATRFRESQVGTIRPGLTLDDGTFVVTDNYLKVRIAPGFSRNERIRVRLTSVNAAVIACRSQDLSALAVESPQPIATP